MLITIVSGEDVSSAEAHPDMEIENVLALAQLELPSVADFAVDKLHLIHNGTKYATSTILKKSLQELNCKDGDVLYLMPMPKELAKLEPSGSAAAVGVLPASKAQRVSQLISSIKVGGGASSSSSHRTQQYPPIPATMRGHVRYPDEQKYRVQMESLFQNLKNGASEHFKEYVQAEAPGIYAAWEKNPNDFDSFFKAALDYRQEDIRRAQLALTDPTSEEGQKWIADMIRRRNIAHTENYAREHMPETTVSNSLLYVKMEINGKEVLGFIDSGAQISVMSEDCVKRCELERLLDYRYKGRASGIGGQAKFLGKLHSVEVRAGTHRFPCQFDVMKDRKIDLLIGLNILKRHQCIIDLGKQILKFGDGTEVPFLNDVEVERYQQSIGLYDDQLDPEKLAHLLELGFGSQEAAQELMKCGNNLEIATANLLGRRDAQNEAQKGDGAPMDQQ